jgi:hypothetical protein
VLGGEDLLGEVTDFVILEEVLENERESEAESDRLRVRNGIRW